MLRCAFSPRRNGSQISAPLRVVKGIFVTRDRPFFPVKREMANFFLVNRDFHSGREA